MTYFWFLVGVLVVLAAIFILYPAFKLTKSKLAVQLMDSEERQRQNVLIYKDRLGELEREFNQGKLEQSVFQALKDELEATLLIDVSDDESGEQTKVAEQITDNAEFGLSALFIVVILIASVAVYFKLGSYDDMLQAQNMPQRAPSQSNQSAADPHAKDGNVNQMLEQLYAKLKTTPDDLDGWMLFARTAMSLEQFDRAVEGLERVANALEKTGQDNAGVLGLLAQAYYMKADGQLTPTAQSVLQSALAKDPDEVNSLSLLARDHFDKGNYGEAINNWQRVLEVAPDHPARANIEQGIKIARERQGSAPVTPVAGQPEQTIQSAQPTVKSPSVAKPNSEVKGAVAQLKVTVSLDAKLAAMANNPSDTVFVFAQPVSGPPMPLAVGKKRVADLPFTILLDDSLAMGPANLSSVERANIVARISKSGQPMPATGDLEGRRDAVDVYSKDAVSVVIQNKL